MVLRWGLTTKKKKSRSLSTSTSTLHGYHLPLEKPAIMITTGCLQEAPCGLSELTHPEGSSHGGPHPTLQPQRLCRGCFLSQMFLPQLSNPTPYPSSLFSLSPQRRPQCDSDSVCLPSFADCPLDQSLANCRPGAKSDLCVWYGSRAKDGFYR